MTALAYNYDDAAAACGYSVKVLREAVAKNDLFPSYANSKPVFLVTELTRWLESLPSDRPASPEAPG